LVTNRNGVLSNFIFNWCGKPYEIKYSRYRFLTCEKALCYQFLIKFQYDADDERMYDKRLVSQ
jgi:hypothetical protein